MRATFIVLTNCKPGTETEFNRWYDDVHIPEILARPGFVGARRGRISSVTDTEPRFRYIAYYDVESDDPQATVAALLRHVKAGGTTSSDTLDDIRDLMLAKPYEPDVRG
jgi:hypothetical protein